MTNKNPPPLEPSTSPEVAYSQGWSDRAALEFDAHRDPNSLAVRLGVCMGGLELLYERDPSMGFDFYKQLLKHVPRFVLLAYMEEKEEGG